VAIELPVSKEQITLAVQCASLSNRDGLEWEKNTFWNAIIITTSYVWCMYVQRRHWKKTMLKNHSRNPMHIVERYNVVMLGGHRSIDNARIIAFAIPFRLSGERQDVKTPSLVSSPTYGSTGLIDCSRSKDIYKHILCWWTIGRLLSLEYVASKFGFFSHTIFSLPNFPPKSFVRDVMYCKMIEIYLITTTDEQ
jgi:hypothetical protein